MANVCRKRRKITIIIVTGLIISAARVTGADQLPVLTACGRDTPNCVTQKSNEGRSQLVSRQWLRREAQGHTQITAAGAAPEAAVSPQQSHTELPAPFKGIRHSAHGTGEPPWSCQALEELAGINWGIPSSSCSPKSAAGKISSRDRLGLAAPCHVPCSRWQVRLGSDLLGFHQPSLVLSNGR